MKHDPLTGMLNRVAFENQVAAWMQRMNSDKGCSFLCAVVLFAENTIEINRLYGRATLADRIGKLSKTVKAFIHPHELCCRYGFGEFAMVLAGNDKETMDERLKMLQIACNARQADNPGLRVLLGYPSGTLMELTNSTPLVLKGLIYGQYTVEELNTTNYTVTITAPVTLTGGATSGMITVRNQEKDKSLPVTGESTKGYSIIGIAIMALGGVMLIFSKMKRRGSRK